MSFPPGVTRSLASATRVAREPIIAVNLVSALVLEVVILLRQFGVPLTDGQVDAINAVAGLLLLIVAAVFGRKMTTPLADPRDKLGQPLTPESPTLNPDLPATDVADTVQPAAGVADAPPLPPIEEDVRKELPTSATTSPTDDDGNPNGGRGPKFW